MKRRTSLAMLMASFILLALMLVTGNASAQEQNLKCCTYTVDIAGFPDACFPFRILTLWEGDINQGNTYYGNGVYTENVPNFADCPPSLGFKWASVNGFGGPFVGIGGYAETILGRCCYALRVNVDQNGCVIIYVRPC